MDINSDANLIDDEPYNIYEFKENTSAKIPGYLLVSTAKLNVETQESCPQSASKIEYKEFFDLRDQQSPVSSKEMIQRIATRLIESQNPEIIINIHGYSTTPADAEKGCKKIYDYVNENIAQTNKYIFIGYRWPSENPFQKDDSGTIKEKLGYAISALPILPSGILGMGLGISIISSLILSILHSRPVIVDIFTTLLILSGIASSIILALIILRLSAYFRDLYRATNYGIVDLVEFIRQLDYTVNASCQNKRIKLSFIGHSMGCFVVTDVIRVLSDVFDVQSINKKPSGDIGNVFCLGQLVLVAPDIPVETILPGRANFLRSSLRRCKEAYIFCNEGDVILRFTSTAANYFSFPAKNRISGYRLGNITVSHFDNQKDKSGHNPKYGIVNLHQQDSATNYTITRPYKYLEIRSSNREHRNLQEMINFSQTEEQSADIFTYFDCTDYKDYRDDNSDLSGIVSNAIQKPAINLWGYVSMTIAFVQSLSNSNNPQGIDPHGGYFNGKFSQKAIYELAFLGFREFLNKSYSTQDQEGIDCFSEECRDKQIQVVLSSRIQLQ